MSRVSARAPGAESIVRVRKSKLTFHCVFLCVSAKYLWPRETIAPVVRVSLVFVVVVVVVDTM